MNWRLIVHTIMPLVMAVWFAACGDGAAEPLPSPDLARPATVIVTPDSATLKALNSTVPLSAEVLDQNGNVLEEATPTWSSSDSSVTLVDDSGLVTAVGKGGATITATSGEVSALILLTVEQVAAAITVTPDQATLPALNSSVAFAAEVLDGNSNLVAKAELTCPPETGPSPEGSRIVVMPCIILGTLIETMIVISAIT